MGPKERISESAGSVGRIMLDAAQRFVATAPMCALTFKSRGAEAVAMDSALKTLGGRQANVLPALLRPVAGRKKGANAIKGRC